MEAESVLLIIGLVMVIVSIKFWVYQETLDNQVKEISKSDILCTIAGVIPLALGLSFLLGYLPDIGASLAVNVLIGLSVLMILVGLFRLLFVSVWKKVMCDCISCSGEHKVILKLIMTLFGVALIAIGVMI